MPTGPIYEANLVGKRLAIPEEVFNVDKDSTPVFSLLRKQSVEANMLGQVTLEKFPACIPTGVLDGTPVTTVAYVEREQADVCAQHFRQPWGVTTLAGLTRTHAVKDEVGHQRAWAMKKLRRAIEIQISSNDDCASESGATPWTTRGIMQWLNPSEQSTRAVPSSFRPASATRHTGHMSTAVFTDAVMKALFAAAYDEAKAPIDVDLFVGSTAKNVIGEMTQADPYRVEGTQELIDKVMVIELDFGYARVHLTPFICYTTSTGLASSYTPLSGFGLARGQWAWEWVGGKNPANTNLAPDGSGDRGYIDAVGRLWSKNPQGQISIYTATTS